MTKRRLNTASRRGNALQVLGAAVAGWGAFLLFGGPVTLLAVGVLALVLGTLTEAGLL